MTFERLFKDEIRIAAYLEKPINVEPTIKGLLQLRSATNLRKAVNLADMQAFSGMVQRRQR
jgi:hypothetical protein